MAIQRQSRSTNKTSSTLIFFITFILSIPILHGCAASRQLDGEANKRVNNYQRIIKVTAYTGSDRTLYLCADLVIKGKNKPQTISTKIAFGEFTKKIFKNLNDIAGPGDVFDARSYVDGCTIKPDFTPVDIVEVTIPWVKNQIPNIYEIIKKLPENTKEISIYFINYEQFASIKDDCRGFFGAKNCYYELTKYWPKIVIQTKNQRQPTIIVAGHSGEKVGHNTFETTGAALVDIVTFPVQALILTFWRLFGSH